MERLLHDLDEVIGHEAVIRYLKDKVNRDTLPNVLLLVGNTGLGKTSVAKILACEIAYKPDGAAKIAEMKKVVIDNNQGTAEVELFNMSQLKQDAEVQNVKERLSLGFSSTGRKVVILDEAHGMTKEQQDSLLTSLEHLPVGVYVIICTTDVSKLRDAFLGRCKTPLWFNSLSNSQIKLLIKQFVEENDLKFEMPLPTVISIISSFTGNEPRRALNLLSNFEPGQLVKTRDLEIFVNVDESLQILQLIKYLYGPTLSGLTFIADLRIENTFCSTLLEATKVALGGQSNLIGRDALLTLRELVEEYGTQTLLGFTTTVCSKSYINRTVLQGAFLQWNYETRMIMEQGKFRPVKEDVDTVIAKDLNTMNETLESRTESAFGARNSVSPVQSLASMMSGGEIIE